MSILRATRGTSNILVACAPKSGSSNLTNRMALLPNFRNAPFVPSYGGREQELDEATIVSKNEVFPLFNLVSQQHLTCSEHTLHLARKYQIKTIVLTRDLRDSLVSLTDHWMKEGMGGSRLFLDQTILDDFRDGGGTDLELAVISNAMWYVNFWLTWKRMSDMFPDCIRPVFVTYEELYKNFEVGFVELMNSLGYEFSQEELNQVFGGVVVDRKNVGKIGRGSIAFSKDPRASAALERVLHIYRNCDLSGLRS